MSASHTELLSGFPAILQKIQSLNSVPYPTLGTNQTNYINIIPYFMSTLKKRAITNKIKHAPLQTAAAKLFPNESHATADVSLIAQ